MYWLQKTENVLAQFGIPLYFLDGNHEWFDGMEQLGIDINGDDFFQVTPHITYLPRGFAWEWDGVRFLSLGGAVSADKEFRDREEAAGTHVKTWWAQESITDAQMERAARRGKVDVMLCHDTVEIPSALMWHLRGYGGMFGPKLDALSRTNREKISYVVRYTHPKFLFHGHYHFSYKEQWEGTYVRGLDRDTRGQDSYWGFDTEDYRNGDQR